jgi:lactoylglutathione lyase
MELCSVYITTEKFNETVEFYEKILQEKPYIFTENRWVEFNTSQKISIYNLEYDKELIKNDNNIEEHFNKAYLSDFNKERTLNNNSVIFNFYSKDLKKEYERLKNIQVKISEIMYVNIREPYWYFNVYDPNGNILEITGEYSE